VGCEKRHRPHPQWWDMGKSLRPTTLEHLREMPSDTALRSLAICRKADASHNPIKDPMSCRWHVRTEFGEFEILTTRVKCDPRAKKGRAGAIPSSHCSLVDY
jgi:hypothetical protein